MTSDLCFGYLLTEELCREYLNPAIPHYETVLQGVIADSAFSALFMDTKKTISFMDSFYVRKFLQDGIPMEYPPYLYRKPFGKDCLRYFVEQKLEASKKGKEELHFFKEGRYPMSRCWQLGVYPAEKIQLNYLVDDHAQVFSVTEPGITYAASDYLQSLLDSPDVLNAEASEKLLCEWCEEYLCK